MVVGTAAWGSTVGALERDDSKPHTAIPTTARKITPSNAKRVAEPVLREVLGAGTVAEGSGEYELDVTVSDPSSST
jgi:hypothetical protein